MAKQVSHLPDGALLSGRYRIVKFIGSGGFGCTYLADHLLFGTKVAIKEFFVSSLCNRDNTGMVSIGTESQSMVVEKLAQKFLREARSLNKLSHPNIVRVSDVFEENGTNYYVMDYIEGRSLHSTMYYDGPLSEKQMMDYISQIMDALEYLHGRGMLHLDIKPDNIMVDEKGHAILIDFGVAKQYGDSNGNNSSNSTVMGQTPGFAPLEQMSNNVKAFSPATDIYALGATMYALLTGVTPPTAPELASGVAELPPLPPYVTDNLRNTLSAMMQVKNSERLQSIADVRAMLAGKPLSGRSSVMKTVYVDDDDDPLTPPPPAPERKKKKGWLIGLLCGLAVVAAAAGVLFALGFFSPKTDDNAVAQHKPDPYEIRSDDPDRDKTEIEEPEPELPQINEEDVSAKPAPDSKSSNSGSGSSAASSGGHVTVPDPETTPVDVKASNAVSPSALSTGVSGPAGHNYVDMGHGMYWATCNIGASSPTDGGYLFAWGEVDRSADYTLKNAAFNTILGTQYDPARVIWGDNWHMPSADEWSKLLDECKWEAKDDGILLTAPNGNTLFLPNKGSAIKGYPGHNPWTYYWSSDSRTPDGAVAITISDNAGNPRKNGATNGSIDRTYCLPVRPVYRP